MGAANSLNIFLKHELSLKAKLLYLVKSSLTNLKLAIDGVVTLNEVSLRKKN